MTIWGKASLQEGTVSAKVLRQAYAKYLVCLRNYSGVQCGEEGIRENSR